jgi:hypothetical protein
MPQIGTYSGTLPNVNSPAIGNYLVGRGFLSMKLQGESTFQDMGNCTRFTFQPSPTRLDHYSSRFGVRKKDLTIVTQLDAKLTMTLEEATVRNMAIQCMGAPLESGHDSVFVMSQPLFYASLQFTATNSVGPQWNALFPLVLLSPTAAFQLIAEGSGNWATMEVEGDIQLDAVTQQYGWFYTSSFVPAS